MLELICLFSAHSPRLVRSSCCLSPLAWHFTIWGSLKFSRNMETSLVLWLNNHLEKHQLGLTPALFHAVKGPLKLPRFLSPNQFTTTVMPFSPHNFSTFPFPVNVLRVLILKSPDFIFLSFQPPCQSWFKEAILRG